MSYRRLFIMRKDLAMSPGKLAAQVGHCAEMYWLRLLRRQAVRDGDDVLTAVRTPGVVYDEYVGGLMTKTICEAKNKAHLLKAKKQAEEMGLIEDEDFGLIYDRCLTELEPEEDDGTVCTGIWFRPLADDVAHKISRKYQLYR